MKICHERTANVMEHRLVQLRRINPPNVVRLENLWIHSRLYSAIRVVFPRTPRSTTAFRPIRHDRPMIVSVTRASRPISVSDHAIAPETSAPSSTWQFLPSTV